MISGGTKGGSRPRFFATCTLACLWILDFPGIAVADQVSRIETLALGAKARISASDRFGGAVDSFVWKGKEFINTADHGRELQSAIAFRNKSECLNPTEAGARDDRLSSSTSVSQNTVTGNTIATRSRLAYWLAPGARSPACPDGALNTNIQSDVYLTKTIRFSPEIAENIFEELIELQINEEAGSYAVLEILTAYLTADFDTVYTYNDGSRADLPRTGEIDTPVVAADRSGQFALGLFCPQVPQPGVGKLGYGWGKHPDPRRIVSTTKLNCIYRIGATKPHAYQFQAFVAFGTASDVNNALEKLSTKFGRRSDTRETPGDKR